MFLCLYFVFVPGDMGYEGSPEVQTAAILGVGLLYRGTRNRLMCEFLVSEIGKRPTDDRCTDR